jgi:hypothetical protein
VADQREHATALLGRQPGHVLVREQRQLRGQQQLQHRQPAQAGHAVGAVDEPAQQESSRHDSSVGGLHRRDEPGYIHSVEVKLYAMAISHPSQAARKMLEIKGVDYELVFPSYPGPLPPFLPSDWLRP